jgi:hypothetical protein
MRYRGLNKMFAASYHTILLQVVCSVVLLQGAGNTRYTKTFLRRCEGCCSYVTVYIDIYIYIKAKMLITLI